MSFSFVTVHVEHPVHAGFTEMYVDRWTDPIELFFIFP